MLHQKGTETNARSKKDTMARNRSFGCNGVWPGAVLSADEERICVRRPVYIGATERAISNRAALNLRVLGQ